MLSIEKKLLLGYLVFLSSSLTVAHAQTNEALNSQVDYVGIYDAHILPDGYLSVLTRKVSQGVRIDAKDFSPSISIAGFGQIKTVMMPTNGLYDLESLYDPKINTGDIQITCLNCGEIPSNISSSFGIVKTLILPESIRDLKSFLENRRLEKSKKATAEAKKIQDEKERERRETAEKSRIAKDGDGSYEDRRCKEFGFKYKTSGYAECRLKLAVMASQSLEREAEYERQKMQAEQQAKAQEKYLAEQNRIAREQLTLQQKEAKRAANQRALDTSLRLLGGQSPADAVISTGTGAPIRPANSSNSQLIQMPNGKMMNCTTSGGFTQCY
jgi:signal transduction histidine kinase